MNESEFVKKELGQEELLGLRPRLCTAHDRMEDETVGGTNKR